MEEAKLRVARASGIRIGVYGVLIGIAGFGIASMIAPETGWTIALIGWLVGLFGIARHFVDKWKGRRMRGKRRQ